MSAQADCCIIIGGAECVVEDFVTARMSFGAMDHFVINESFKLVSHMDQWCTLHPEKLRRWEKEAYARGRTPCPIWVPDFAPDDLDTVMHGTGYDEHWKCAPWDRGQGNSGSSGMFAISIAFSLGYAKIILAGVPMDDRPHFDRAENWQDRDRFVTAWSAAAPSLSGKVKSMSGWTRELLGAPDEQWWGH